MRLGITQTSLVLLSAFTIFQENRMRLELLKQVWYFSRLSLYLIFKNEYVSKISAIEPVSLIPSAEKALHSFAKEVVMYPGIPKDDNEIMRSE